MPPEAPHSPIVGWPFATRARPSSHACESCDSRVGPCWRVRLRVIRSRKNASHAEPRPPPRPTGSLLSGRLRARMLAQRLGAAIREARHHVWQAPARRRSDRGRVAVVGQPDGAWPRRWGVARDLGLRRRRGRRAARRLSRASAGATLPRDHAHLRGQEAVIRFARTGGWRPMPEARARSARVPVPLCRRAPGAREPERDRRR